MNECINCKGNCLEETVDRCVLYTGPDFPRFGVKNGGYYNDVIVLLLAELQTHIEQRVDLKCLYQGECDTCDTFVEVPAAIKVIINKICRLSSSDISYAGGKYCIGNGSITSGAIQLLGKSFKYGISPATNGSSISYDLSDIVASLPSDHRIGKVSAVVSGQTKNGKSIIIDSDKHMLGATIDNDRFPVNLYIDMRVNTPTGDVKLVKSINIPSPMSGQYTGSMNVQDFGSDAREEYSLETFMDAMAAQVCALTSEMRSLKNIDIGGTSGSIADLLGHLNAKIGSVEGRMDRMNTENSSSTDSCGLTSYTGSQPDAIPKADPFPAPGKTLPTIGKK